MTDSSQRSQHWLMRAKQDVVLEEFVFNASQLGPRAIAVRTEFTAISPGTECANYLALDPDVLTPGRWCSYPWVPGYAGVGNVTAVGSAVTEYKIGDRVVGSWPHVSHCTCDVDGDLVPAEPGVNPTHVAHTPIIGIAMTPLQLIRHDPLPTVGVWGLGMIGNLVAQLFQRAGGHVTGIDPVAERRVLASKCGVRRALAPSELTPGQEFDITVDTTGHAPTTVQIPEFTRRRGQVVLMTHWRNQPVTDGTPFINSVFRKGLSVHGAHTNAPGFEPGCNRAAPQRRKWMKIQRELALSGLTVAPLTSHVIDPTRCKEAYEGLCFDKSKWWGVVVDWRGGKGATE